MSPGDQNPKDITLGEVYRSQERLSHDVSVLTGAVQQSIATMTGQIAATSMEQAAIRERIRAAERDIVTGKKTTDDLEESIEKKVDALSGKLDGVVIKVAFVSGGIAMLSFLINAWFMWRGGH